MSLIPIPQTPAKYLITFGNLTSDGVLVGYRIGGLDWAFTIITCGEAHLFVSPDKPGSDLTGPISL